MTKPENTALLAHKRRIDAERRARAIDRAHQDTLRRITPGTATPATVMSKAVQR